MPFTLTGSDVRRLRGIAGVTQKDLARSLGYSRQAIGRWEQHGDASIPRTQYQRVLDYLRSRYDLNTGQRRQVATMFQQVANQ